MEERRGHQLPGERFCPMEERTSSLVPQAHVERQKVPGRGRVCSTATYTTRALRRTVGSARGGPMDSGKIVNSVETGLVVGLKKRYSYKNEASVHHGCWIMYEFELLDRSKKQKKNNDYVLCLLRKMGNLKVKRKKTTSQEEVLGVNYVL
ncbi:hypothetical protein M0R45_026678 [Rubus argutus]|uniref:NAC domain-containing protein n=1 Tax=Rubus argutus TaxID=59490 RepID=A0AAW1WZJ8_RUBAR